MKKYYNGIDETNLTDEEVVAYAYNVSDINNDDYDKVINDIVKRYQP